MKTLPLTIFLAALILTGAARADFRDGVAAFRDGDYRRAASMWQQDAEAGDPAAQRNLGLLYLNGLGVPRSASRAADWFRRAADQSFAPAAANLADLYLKGSGVPRDLGLAADYLTQAAEAGHAESQHNLAVLHEHGVGVPKDVDTAIQWYRKAASRGFEKSRTRLAARAPEAPATDPDAAETADQATAPRLNEPDGLGLVENLVFLFAPAN